jgi:hypothetical protein
VIFYTIIVALIIDAALLLGDRSVLLTIMGVVAGSAVVVGTIVAMWLSRALGGKLQWTEWFTVTVLSLLGGSTIYLALTHSPVELIIR